MIAPQTTPHYAGGQWTVGQGWWVTDLCPAGADWTESVQHSYSTVAELGAELVLQVFLYQRTSGDPELPPFFLEVFDGDRLQQFITASTFPDAMDLLARWAPVCTATILGTAMEAVFDFGHTYGGLWAGPEASPVIDLLARVRANDGHIKDQAAEIIQQRETNRRVRAEDRRRALAARNGGTP